VVIFAVSTWAFAGPAEDAAAQAGAALAAGDFDSAIKILEKVVSDNPFETAGLKDMLGRVHSARGWNRLGAGDNEGALADFKQANVNEREKRSVTYLGLGYTLYRLKNSDDALYYLHEAEYLDQSDGRVHMLLGQIYYERGKLDEAARELQLAVDSGQDIPGLKDYLAKVKKEQGVEESFTKRETYYFNIKYEGEEKRELGDFALKTMSAAYADVGGDLGCYPKEPVNVILYTRRQFNDVTDAPSWSGGIFDGNIRVPVGGANIDREALAAVLYHEYTHAVIRMVAGSRLPTWLDEGIAQYEERWVRQPKSDQPGPDIRPLSTLNGSFMAIGDAQAAKQAYAESLSAVEFYVSRYGMYSLSRLVRLIGEGSKMDAAMNEAAGVSFGDFEGLWRASIGG
jgi:tetratricopeptide (TPR) repeat protein